MFGSVTRFQLRLFDSTHATYHYSHIFEKAPSEAELQRLVKYASMGFTARFKERTGFKDAQ